MNPAWPKRIYGGQAGVSPEKWPENEPLRRQTRIMFVATHADWRKRFVPVSTCPYAVPRLGDAISNRMPVMRGDQILCE
jgi:hypothetical protein